MLIKAIKWVNTMLGGLEKFAIGNLGFVGLAHNSLFKNKITCVCVCVCVCVCKNIIGRYGE